jgi:hypothetical protein
MQRTIVSKKNWILVQKKVVLLQKIKMTDMKTKSETNLFQNLKMTDKFLKKTKLSLTERFFRMR